MCAAPSGSVRVEVPSGTQCIRCAHQCVCQGRASPFSVHTAASAAELCCHGATICASTCGAIPIHHTVVCRTFPFMHCIALLGSMGAALPCTSDPWVLYHQGRRRVSFALIA